MLDRFGDCHGQEIGIFPWLNRLGAFSIYRIKGAMDGQRELE
jgi:hypothetical protein